ncbi:integrase/recombinase XerD [Peptoclostridium litorale DSM 5388]|uniref:Tyrosine recombinase XerC n=1 Tax=Peptoclostridium litorale DSM 5388 TaxID=1121324 RepID=A0A069RRL3_PEPLI|nr:tyrosine-type recombinase/integrase [Peptoclostridium litorale]KDR96817.1 tyrosine recombinase XerC [Peptoclostridium litorale DSM 5388]SIO36506.1 integrase/recombinase XerD [Peptoclostridium litorale DSM 5388]
MQEYVGNYAEFAKNDINRNLSSGTIKSYLMDLREFSRFYRGDISKLSQKDIYEYKRHLQEEINEKTGRLLSVKTINRRLVSLKQFLDYLKSEAGVDMDVVVKQEKVQHQNILPEMLSNSDVKRMLAAAKRKGDSRAAAIICTLFFTGARVSEILQIKVRDADKDEIWIVGKGEKHRRLFIPKRLSRAWAEYLGEKSEMPHDACMFSGQKGPLTRHTIHKILKFYAGQAHVKKSKVHAHAFRHLYTKNIAVTGVNSAIIKQLLGHQLSTTEVYMQVSRKELFKIIENIGV